MINFEDNLSGKSIILRYTSKPERGLYLFYNPLINFFICNILGEKEKQKTRCERACKWRKQAYWLVGVFFIEIVTGPAVLSIIPDRPVRDHSD